VFTKANDFRLIHFDYDDWLGKSKLWLWPTDIDGLNRLTLIILIEIVFLIYFLDYDDLISLSSIVFLILVWYFDSDL
jgi:hypothetical protein